MCKPNGPSSTAKSGELSGGTASDVNRQTVGAFWKSRPILIDRKIPKNHVANSIGNAEMEMNRIHLERTKSWP